MKGRNLPPRKRKMALHTGLGLLGLWASMAFSVWGRNAPRRSHKQGQGRDRESSGVNPDQRYQEPLGPSIAWGQLDQLGGKYIGVPFLLSRQIFIIGRQADCDIIIEDDRASRYHVMLTWDHGKGYLRDNNSMNGTIVNGQPGLGTVLLRHGDIIEVAGSEFRFTYTEASGLAVLDSQPTEKFALPGVATPEAKPHVRARLTALTGPEPGRGWPIVAGVVTIGRGGDNIVVLPHVSVSRHHAQIIVQPSGLYIQDVGSINGASVNGEALLAPRLLGDGDHIQIGDILLVCKIEQLPVATEDQPTQQLPATMPIPARQNPADPPFRGAMTRPGNWRSSAPAQPDNTPAPPSQFRAPPLHTHPLPATPEQVRHMPRFHPTTPPDDEEHDG